MLDFMFALERLLKIWPDNAKWDITQIAKASDTRIHLVLEFLSDVLGKELEVHEPLSFNEVSRARALMYDRLRGEIEKKKQQELKAAEEAGLLYEKMLEKVRAMQITGNWRGAYKTLSYFYGLHRSRLAADIMIQIADECLRSGIKSLINFQELAQWLKIGMEAFCRSHTSDVVEEALDFVDAYGNHFLESDPEKGEQLLKNIFLMLKPSAMEFDLTPKFNDVALGLNLGNVVDVYA
jgi:hypothetical protein